ncbi:MAG: zinc ribbon domain-containing protein [Nitrososphaerota archaeon]|nr:zinc ribbon domain-containing protein [Nitrososphaerota archaeon]
MSEERRASYCPHCGSSVPGGAAYCGACGGRLPSAGGSPWFSRRRGTVLFVVVLLAAASFTGALYSLGASASQDTQGFAAYSDPQARLSFMLPAGWSQVQNRSSMAEFMAPGGGAFLQLFDNGNASEPLSTLVEMVFTEVGATPQTGHVTQALNPSVSGETISEIGIGVGGTSSLVTVFESGGTNYSLVCGTSYQQFVDLLAVCESISSSLALSP